MIVPKRLRISSPRSWKSPPIPTPPEYPSPAPRSPLIPPEIPSSFPGMSCLRQGAQAWNNQPAPLELPAVVNDFVFVVHPGYDSPTISRTIFKLPSYDLFLTPCGHSAWGCSTRYRGLRVHPRSIKCSTRK